MVKENADILAFRGIWTCDLSIWAI